MHKFKLLPLLVLTLFISFLTGCDKDEEDKVPTRTSILTSVIWQGNRAFVDGQDVTSFIDMDNTTMEFKSDGRYVIVLSATPNTGTWEFISNEQKILLDKGTDDELTIDILELSATNLNVKWIEEDEDTGENHRIELRFTNK